MTTSHPVITTAAAAGPAAGGTKLGRGDTALVVLRVPFSS
jgi:hypothetical protein